MAVVVCLRTMAGGVTPACDDCGIFLCWDLAEEEYLEDKAFWDAWKCEDCNGGRMSLRAWRERHGTSHRHATPERRAVVA